MPGTRVGSSVRDASHSLQPRKHHTTNMASLRQPLRDSCSAPSITCRRATLLVPADGACYASCHPTLRHTTTASADRRSAQASLCLPFRALVLVFPSLPTRLTLPSSRQPWRTESCPRQQSALAHSPGVVSTVQITTRTSPLLRVPPRRGYGSSRLDGASDGFTRRFHADGSNVAIRELCGCPQGCGPPAATRHRSCAPSRVPAATPCRAPHRRPSPSAAESDRGGSSVCCAAHPRRSGACTRGTRPSAKGQGSNGQRRRKCRIGCRNRRSACPTPSPSRRNCGSCCAASPAPSTRLGRPRQTNRWSRMHTARQARPADRSIVRGVVGDSSVTRR